MQQHQILNAFLEGLGDNVYGMVAAELQAGTPLLLCHQIDDEDEHADAYLVNVYIEDDNDVNHLLGTLGSQEVLANLIDADVAVSCAVISHNHDAPLDERLHVGVWIAVDPT